jgi:hypothetical protein
MGLCIDKGFTHKIAEEVLKDSPNNVDAKKLLVKPKYRVSINGHNKYFDDEAEINSYLNGTKL